MPIEQANMVDFLSAHADAVILTISDHLDWDEENKHLLLLQDKINSSLAFIESGEILQQYTDSKGRRPVISVKVMHQPTNDALTFFEAVTKVCAEIEIGFQFEYTPLGGIENADR